MPFIMLKDCYNHFITGSMLVNIFILFYITMLPALGPKLIIIDLMVRIMLCYHDFY